MSPGVPHYRDMGKLADEGIHNPILQSGHKSEKATEDSLARMRSLGYTDDEAKKLQRGQ